MFGFITSLQKARCSNRIATFGWFLGQRFGRPHREHVLRVKYEGRNAQLPVTDLPTLCAALALFSKSTPWERWQPAVPPKRIMDLGANVGLASLYFHLRFPAAEIVAVEMMPENAAALERLAKLNAMPLNVVNMAVGDKSGEAVVRCNEQHTRHSLAGLEEEVGSAWGFTDKRVKVPIVRLTEVLDRVGWPEVDLLKIDIEGAEQLLLHDLAGWATRARTVFMEIHHNVSADEAAADLGRHGSADIGGGEHTDNRTEMWFARANSPAASQ